MFPLHPNESEGRMKGARAAEPDAVIQEFSLEERRLLLQLAHQAIRASVEGRQILPDLPPHLAEPRGVFTTLYLRGQLHGCVGYVFPTAPLCRAVAETARAAAFHDPRFPPLQSDEAAGLTVSLSVLSRLASVRPEQIEIGRHGLLVSLGGHRGLLLPQVAPEHSWDRQTFLEQTCRKAGLPPDAWERGATIEAFTAEIFSDDEQGLPGLPFSHTV
jgi:uncharacterized protein